MKKVGNINTSKFMSIVKSGRNKRIAAATTAVLLTGAVIVSSVFNNTQAAENADTLMGIEKLRNQFSEGNEYTVLEIVPDIQAAEIGYLFDGYEPVLSEWDSETMTWKSWKDVLCSFDTKAERQAFMAQKKKALDDYYAAQGITDNFPVTSPKEEEYDDSEDYVDGYEEVEAGSYDMTGYFVPITNNTGKYYVSFEYVSYDNILKNPDAVYYNSYKAWPILSADEGIAEGTYVYKNNGTFYQCVGTWGELLQSGVTFPSSSEEPVPDDDDKDDDDKKDDDKKNDDNTDDDGNGDNGDGDGENGAGDNGDETGGDNGSENAGDGSEDGAEETGGNDKGDNVGETGGNDTTDDNSGNDEKNIENNVASANNALGSSFAQVKWIKYVNTDDDKSKTPSSGEKETDNSGTGNEGGNNSGTGGSGSTTTDEDGGNQSEVTEPAGGDNTGEGSGETGGDNTGNTGEGSGETGGDNTGDNPGDNEGDDPGENTGDESGDNPDGDKSDDNSDDDKKDSDKNPDKDNSIGQTVKAQDKSESYSLVYFERETNIDSLRNTGAYVVTGIRPAKLSIDEVDHTGQYDFVENKEDNTQTYTFPGRVLYCKGIFHNNEWFKQYVINMNKENFDNFKVKVITLTPEMLNDIYAGNIEEYEQGTIPDFDFLYLNSGMRTNKDIVITTPPDVEEPNKDEGSDNVGDNDDTDKPGDDDNTGDNDDTDKTGDGDNTGDNGDTDKPGDGDNTGDNGDIDKPGDDDNSGDGSDTDKSGDGDGDNAGDTSDADKTGNDDSIEEGGSTDSGNGGNVDSSTDDSNTGESVNKDNSSNAENKNSESKTNNINNSSYSGKSSLWKAFVSKDDSVDVSKSEAEADSDTSNDDGKNTTDTKTDDNSTGNTGDTEATGSTGNEDDTVGGNDNDNIADDTNSNDDTTGDDENKDDSENKDNPDDTGGSNTDDVAEPDKSEEGNDDSESDKEKPSSDSANKSDAPMVLYSTAGVDLVDGVSNLIFKTVSAKALPCLVDGSILYGKTEGSGAISPNTENTELFRLAAMLCQETLEKDYTSLSKEKLMNGIVDDADKNYTTEQVYCRLGNGKDSIINDNFFKYTIYKEGGDVEEGFQNVLDEIKLENLYRESDSSGKYKPLPTNIAQAEAVRHILNYQNRRNVETKKSIKVLEIQPAYTTEPELTKKQIQKWAPGVEEVETTIMTTAEFIGKIDKLNEIYDLIYIGTSKEHLNISNWVTDTGKSKDNKYLGSTVFNDSDMDGLIYYNVGDKRVVNLPMAGLLDSEYKNGRTYYYNFARYSGNDITKEKEDALISFLNGSYPIVVSDDFIEQPVTVFEDEDYAGRRATLNVGEYEENDLLDNQIFAGSGTPTKGISSIQVKKGYQITLFENSDFTGDSITLKEDMKNFTTSSARLAAGQTWNNRCRSAIVEKVEDAQPVRALDGNHIDSSSYLYNFAHTALEKKYTNFYAKGDIDETGSELFKFYLNRPKASLIDFSTNGIPSGSLDGTSIVNDVNYIYPNTIGRYTLQYNFTIKNEGAASMDTRYNCKLYIDVNADGKFSEFEEVSDIVMTNRQNGGVVSSDELYAGVPYTITREVPNGYKGLLPWKVEVCQVNNDNIYASTKGYTKLSGMDKETLKICQINKNTDNELRVIDLEYEIETKGRYFNTLVYGGDYDGVHYPGIDNDFELNVESIDISKFESYYNPSSPDYNPDYLKDFNMLILGFSDAYDDFSGSDTDPNTPLGAVVEFINSGKSVLMGHDNTSYWNNPIVDGAQLGYPERNKSDTLGPYKPDSRFAANINKYIRPMVGMDRYGVLSSPTVKRGVALKEGDAGWGDLLSSGKEVAYKPKSARKETVPEAQGFTYAIINVRDTDQNSKEKRDYSKYNLYSGDYNNRSDFSNTYVSQRFDTCYYSESYSDKGEINSAEKSQNTSGKVQNVHVTQVNQGQITEYPYKLKEDFEVAQTHAQYYQLDYTADDDGDGQSDLVVWYCLGGRTSGTKEKQTTIYSQSPNDVRNNYYIYNKGNITYSGLGHGANDKKKKEDNLAYTFEEAKLFINTIIASYQAGVKPPTVTVLDSGSPDASQMTTMYRYYDNQHLISITDAVNKDNYEKVYFTVRDVNFVKGLREIAAHAYYHIDGVGGSETITVGGEEISVTPLADLMYDPKTDNLVDAGHLTSGEIYYILVPKDVISNCEKGLDIYFEAQSTVTTNTTTQNVYTTDKVYAKLQVLRAYLFELD
ncbi:MAG: DUF5057 domain-containing protein [Lachnospiraceae bacterium]|nr:DUF5057 domain-containing protein [Lachnospiraceae bacterium]